MTTRIDDWAADYADEHVTATTIDADLARMAAHLNAEAKNSQITLDGDPLDYLRRVRQEKILERMETTFANFRQFENRLLYHAAEIAEPVQIQRKRIADLENQLREARAALAVMETEQDRALRPYSDAIRNTKWLSDRVGRPGTASIQPTKSGNVLIRSADRECLLRDDGSFVFPDESTQWDSRSVSL